MRRNEHVATISGFTNYGDALCVSQCSSPYTTWYTSHEEGKRKYRDKSQQLFTFKSWSAAYRLIEWKDHRVILLCSSTEHSDRRGLSLYGDNISRIQFEFFFYNITVLSTPISFQQGGTDPAAVHTVRNIVLRLFY